MSDFEKFVEETIQALFVAALLIGLPLYIIGHFVIKYW